MYELLIVKNANNKMLVLPMGVMKVAVVVLVVVIIK